jgi:OTU-like cysteine protease
LNSLPFPPSPSSPYLPFTLLTPSPSPDPQPYFSLSLSLSLSDVKTQPKFTYYKWLDALDTEQQWIESQIKDINYVDRCVLIHYKGWKAQFDEWIPMDSDRLAELHTHTTHPPRVGYVPCKSGTLCDALDSTDKWEIAIIMDVTRYQVKIHYSDWGAQYDEWINRDSYRLAPLHTKTAPRPKRRDELKLNFGTTYQASVNDEQRFGELLRRKCSYSIIDMAPDGNCLFRAISHQVYGDQDWHHIVRARCVEYLRNQLAFYEQWMADDPETYLSNMDKDAVWGGHIEIQAMSELYGRPVYIYAYSSEPRVVGVQPNGAVPIRVSYHGQHYNAVLDPSTYERGLLTTPPGQFENERIALLRPVPNDLESAIVDSDVNATDQEQLHAALTESRREFERNPRYFSADDMKSAIQASLQNIDQIADSELKTVAQASEQEYLNQVIDQSRREFDAKMDAVIPAVQEVADAVPVPVKNCHESMHMPLDLCIEAYQAVMLSIDKDNMPPEMVMTQLVAEMAMSLMGP